MKKRKRHIVRVIPYHLAPETHVRVQIVVDGKPHESIWMQEMPKTDERLAALEWQVRHAWEHDRESFEAVRL
jgi:hypothetical protein